jgi:branched-chain amino acid transport system ATP-binding protein
MATPILSVESVDAGYGEVHVLHGVSLHIAAGGITALLGSNGAGKTTLLRTIAGLLPASAGRVAYQGASLHGLPASARVDRGIVLVPEGRLIFGDFTVEENLLAGAFCARARSRRAETLEEMYARFPMLRQRRRQMGGTLSGGQQQILAIARGLMSRPALLLLDEPSLGLAPMMVAELFAAVRDIRDAGITVLIVEQNVRATLELADDGFVLETGRITLRGSASALLGNDAVRQAYLGL